MGVPSRGRLGLGVTEVELLRGRQKLVSTFIPDDSQRETAETQADAPPHGGQVSAFTKYSKDHKSMSLEYWYLYLNLYKQF